MKKHIYSFIALLLVAQMAWAKVTLPEDIPAYWASVDGKSSVSLFNELSAATAVGYKSLGYDGLWVAYGKTDVYPSDSVGRAGEIWDTYSACHFALSQHGSYSRECDRYNREHSVPQSWWGKGTSNQGCDIFHVIPTDGYVNNWRGNDPYGEVSSAQKTSTNGCKSGPSARAGCSGTVFEPADQYKGDIARGILGAMVKWKGSWTKGQGSSTFTGTYTEEENFGLTQYAVDLFMKWHREDPISRKEVDRNNGIQATQGNRNPFIDYPYLAEYIWGERVGEKVDMSKMMPSTDADFILGVSNGWRGDTVPPTPPTPPTPATKYGVTWMVNGDALYTDSIEENKYPTTLPDEPTSCSAESNVFVGWTDEPISGIAEEAPTLFTKPDDFPPLHADVMYYAVFAKMDTVEFGPQLSEVSFVFDASGLSFEDDGVSVLFDKAEGSNAPKYYEPAIRCYPNNTITVSADGITNILFTFAANDGTNPITPSVGAFDSDTTWVGNTEEVVFTVGGNSGHRKISAMTVTRNGSGSGTVYSRYITSCQGPQEIELVETEAPVRKILVGGHLFILRDGHIYNVHGARVR